MLLIAFTSLRQLLTYFEKIKEFQILIRLKGKPPRIQMLCVIMRKKMLPQRKVFSSTNANSTQTQKAKRPLEKMENRKIQQIWTKRRKRHYLLQGGRLLGKASLYLSTPLLGRATKKKLQRVMVEKMASIAPVRFVKLSCPENRTLKNRAGI